MTGRHDPDEVPVNADAGLWTVANVVSLLRLAAVPFFLWLLLGREDYVAAAWAMGVIGATDWLDGSLARRLNQVSEIGTFLDPLADRIAIFAAIVGGLIAGVVPALIAWPLIIREVVVASGALYLVRRFRENVAVKYMGKVATFIVYWSIPSFYLAAAEVADGFWRPVGWLTGIVGLVLYYWVTWDYFQDIRAKLQGRPAA